jgi:hypothetical protein
VIYGQPQDEEEAQPPARRDELPTGLQVMREEKDVDMEDETSQFNGLSLSASD